MSTSRYSIKDLENFTGIKAHTIRIWEQRYNLLSPQRTDTNIRYYSESDLKKILNINLLYTNGLKISKIAALSESGIRLKAKDLIDNLSNPYENDIDDLILSTLEFDKVKLEKIISKSWDNEGVIDCYINLINPFLTKVGKLWQINTVDVIHEHFFSNTLREFIYCKINSLQTKSNNQSVGLFLHETEQHELVILIYYFIFKQKGFDCYYFGRNLPIESLEHVFEKFSPDYLITTFTSILEEGKFEEVLSTLDKYSADSKIIISGSQCNLYPKLIPSKFKHLKEASELNKFLSNL